MWRTGSSKRTANGAIDEAMLQFRQFARIMGGRCVLTGLDGDWIEYAIEFKNEAQWNVLCEKLNELLAMARKL